MNITSDLLITRIQENLRQIRSVMKLTATDFAEYMGITRQTVNNLESRKSTLGHTQVIAVLSIIDHRVRKNSREWHWIQEILAIDLAVLGTDSFLEFWFRLIGLQVNEPSAELKLSYLYDHLTKEISDQMTIDEFVDRNDKIYLFYDFLLRKECFIFFDQFVNCISNRQKILPLVVLKTHLQALLTLRTPESESHIVKLYEKMNQLKERRILWIEDSAYMQADFLEDYHAIYHGVQERNFFVSILTENQELAEIAQKPCLVYSWKSFSGITNYID